jgi:hypothetical protein
MTRTLKQQDKTFRGVVVYRKTEENPNWVPPQYAPTYVPSSGGPRYFHLDEPSDLVTYYGPYSRKADVHAAFRRMGITDRLNKLDGIIYSIRIEEADLVWKTLVEG